MSPAAIVLTIAFVFIALCLACALWIGRRRPPAADPFSIPFGEMPGFSAEQLRAIAPEVRNDDPLRRSFAVKNRLKRDSELLWRLDRESASPRHQRPLYGSACIRCGASTAAELAADCIADPWSAFTNSAGPSQPCGKRAAGVSSFSPRQTAARTFFALLRGRS